MTAGQRPLKVLILGGYGTFGGRLAELLSDEPRLKLIIAGRSQAKADAFCENLPSRATLESAVVNRDRRLATRLAELAPDLVVDASGPFQAYGDEPYRVVKAVLLAGAHYLDLADGSAFVRGIGQFDAVAKKKNRFVLSGLSTCPVLTAAAVRQLSRDLASIDSIAGGIAPSPRAGLGRNVVAAAAACAGKPIELRRNGRTETAYPFTETMRCTVAPPGAVPLDSIEFSLLDVPDLTLLPELWPEVRSVWIGVGPVPAILHRCLRWLAHGVRWRLIPSLVPLAPLMHAAISRLRWGEHRGGLFVEIEGKRADGAVVRRSWHLIGEGEEGPNIPSMAAEAVIRRLLEGRPPSPGARPALRELELADYEQSFARRAIVHGERRDTPGDSAEPSTRAPAEDEPLFRRVLGSTWTELPWSIREVHGSPTGAVVTGRATVERGKGWVAALVARTFEFPDAAEDIGLRVTIRSAGSAETWRRAFGKQEFESELYAGTDRYARLLCERFGPFVFGMALVLERGRLEYVTRRWSVFGIPLPRWLIPRSAAYEYEIDGRFHFHVEIADRLFGPIVTYSGHLERPEQIRPRPDRI